MSEEGGPTVGVTPAELLADPSACARTEGMQQQTHADTEEKRVSGFSAGVLLGPGAPAIWAQLESGKI